jgi:hypothetical protein
MKHLLAIYSSKQGAFLLTLIAILIIPASSCNRCPDCEPPPLQVGLRLLDANNQIDLLYSDSLQTADVEIFYMDQQTKIQLPVSFIRDTSLKMVTILPLGWCQKSSLGVKTLYLQFMPTDIDTIQLDVTQTTEKCCRVEKLTQYNINGKPLDKNNSTLNTWEFRK